MEGPEAAPSGSEVGFDSSVDRLVEGLNGLQLSNNSSHSRIQEKELTPGARARPRAQEPGNKENDTDGVITPSRLTCLKQLREELTCAVCIDICVRPVTTPCGHNYCRSCLRRSLELNRPRCPKCRADLPAGTALHINTSLWITIQHLFPSEAGAKPLTPPVAAPAAAQQPHPSGAQRLSRQGAAAHATGHAAAPFRPPRFVPAVVPTASFFTGHSSSRANASAAGMGGMSVASPSGRSMSGPRPQRPAPSGQTNAGQQASGPVPSLAELGMRPGRGGGGGGAAAAQRDRRRSRSAERWAGAGRSLLASADDFDDAEGPVLVTAAARPPAAGFAVGASAQSHAALPASSSRLMDLLSGPPPRNAAAVGIYGSRQQGSSAQRPALGRSAAAAGTISSSVQAAGDVRSLNNPFLRERGPAQPSQAATATSARAGQVLSAAAAAGVTHFTASQRALLDARAHAQGPSSDALRPPASGRPASGPGSAALRTRVFEEAVGPDSEVAAAPAPRVPSASSQSSGSCSSGGYGSGRPGDAGSLATQGSLSSSSWSAPVLDDASELELLEPESGGGRLLPSRSSGGGVGAGSATGPGRLLATAMGPSGRPAAGAVRAAEPPRRRRLLQLCDSDDSDDDIDIELLDEPTPPAAHLVDSCDTAGSTATAAGLSSPTWNQLDEQVARALEPLTISPPSLPRLRLSPRQGDAPVQQRPPSAAQVAAVSAAGDSHPRQAGTGGSAAAGSGDGSVRHMDPDLASNYDGEDPAGADTFFSSPFFDRNLLRETLEEAAAVEADADRAVALSPRWAEAAAVAAAAGAGSRGGGGEALEEWRRQDEDVEAGLVWRTDAADRPAGDSLQPVPGQVGAGALEGAAAGGRSRGDSDGRAGLREARLPGAAHPAAPAADLVGAAAAADQGRQIGDRGCPIELLSDSDGEDQDPGLRPTGPAAAASLAAVLRGAAAEPAPRRSSQRVVSGLRRQDRT